MTVKSVTLKGIGTVEVRVLESSADYMAWSRDVRRVCAIHDIWKLCTGEQEFLLEPKIPQISEDECCGWAKYRRDRQDWQEQQDEIKAIRRLLMLSVSERIFRNIAKFEKPKEILDYVGKHFAPEKSPRGIFAALNEMENAAYEKCDDVLEFITQLQHARDEIVAAGGEFSNQSMVYKLALGLPKEYDGFIERHIKAVTDIPEFDDLMFVLMDYEHGLRSVEETWL